MGDQLILRGFCCVCSISFRGKENLERFENSVKKERRSSLQICMWGSVSETSVAFVSRESCIWESNASVCDMEKEYLRADGVLLCRTAREQ